MLGREIPMWQSRIIRRINSNPRHYTLDEMKWRVWELWADLILMIGLFITTIVPLFFT